MRFYLKLSIPSYKKIKNNFCKIKIYFNTLFLQIIQIETFFFKPKIALKMYINYLRFKIKTKRKNKSYKRINE